MKILLVNAPFITYNGSFKDIERRIFQQKVYKTLDAMFSYPNFGWQKSLVEKISNVSRSNFINQEGFRYGVRAGSRWPWTSECVHGDSPYPFIMGYCGAYLKSHGFDVEIKDGVVSECFNYKKFIKEMQNSKPDIVIIECAAVSIEIDLYIAKEASKFAKVALAGPHFTDEIVENLRKNNSYIDFFLKGEYILSSLEMVTTQKKGVYESKIVEDLDEIGFPLRDYKDADKYFEVTMPTAKPQLQIYASKGCPFKCSFCLWPQLMYKGKVCFRDPYKVAEEIKYNVDKYNYKSIFFDDDTFNLGVERISLLCDLLKEIGLPWTMMGRLDCSPDWLYDKMVDCGCVGMRFGVETFNIEVLKNINKGLERVDFLKTLEYITEKHPSVWIHLTMMKDLPLQTEEIHKKDLAILKNLGYSRSNIKRSFQLGSCVPFKGTVLYRQLEKLIGKERLEKENKFDGSKNTLMTKLNQENVFKSGWNVYD